MSALTPKQLGLLNFIRSYIASHGYAPSYREMCVGVGCSSKGQIADLLRAIEERGAVRVMRHRARGIVVVESDTLTIRLAPDLRSEVDKIAARENTRSEIVASELIRAHLGMSL